MKRPEAAATVVEHTVEHQTHAAAVHGSDQGIECCVPAQQRINLEVVVGVITVVGGGAENRREVEARDPHVLQLIQRLDHAVEITTLKSLLAGIATPGLKR